MSRPACTPRSAHSSHLLTVALTNVDAAFHALDQLALVTDFPPDDVVDIADCLESVRELLDGVLRRMATYPARPERG